MVRRHILEPITFQQFGKALGKLNAEYQAYTILIYYTGIRVSEALRLKKESFSIDQKYLYVDVGIRLKTQRKRKDGTVSAGKKTMPLPLDLTQPYIDILVKKVRYTRKNQEVFPFHRTTALRQITKVGLGYNHLARLTAITSFLRAGRSIADIVNWFGISVQTVNNYIGRIDLKEMGAIRR
jgi:integrase